MGELGEEQEREEGHWVGGVMGGRAGDRSPWRWEASGTILLSVELPGPEGRSQPSIPPA